MFIQEANTYIDMKYCPFCGSKLDDKGCTKNKSVIAYKEIISYLNKKAGTRYRHTTNKYKQHISARWREGFRLEDFKNVIDYKVDEWIDSEKMRKYLRPQTLFNQKMDWYVNQIDMEDFDTGSKNYDDIVDLE
jgi:uncharacterized phage protein (TIGR02220 family)